MVVVAAHLDASGTSVAVEHQLHDRSCLAKLIAIAAIVVELGLREDARLLRCRQINDHVVVTGINRHAAEAISNVRCFDVATTDHFFDYCVASDLRINLIHFAVGQSIDRLHNGCRLILGKDTDKVACIDEVDDVRGTINFGRTKFGIVQSQRQHRVTT